MLHSSKRKKRLMVWIISCLTYPIAVSGIFSSRSTSSEIIPYVPPLIDPSTSQLLKGRELKPSLFSFTNIKGQFLEMPRCQRIRPADNLKISFEFFTSKPNAMLLYLDDGGPGDYTQLSLSQSKMNLLFKFGSGPHSQMYVGDSLSDSNWHSVSLGISDQLLNLTVDKNMATELAGKHFSRTLIPVSSTFLGGIPTKMPLGRLSRSAVFFDSGYVGKIRRYAVNGIYQSSLNMFGVTEDRHGDVCYPERNPCKNNGNCYLRNGAPACLCIGTGFYGKTCDDVISANSQRDSGSRARFDNSETFSGNGRLEYSLNDEQIQSLRDTISLSFKTRRSNGLILHTGMSSDYVTLSIKDGSVLLMANLGAGSISVLLEPVEGTFSDNVWHSVRVNRELHRVNLTVDDACTTQRFTQERYSYLSLNDVFYVGGTPSTSTLPGSPVKSNFVGCLRDVVYTSNDATYQFSQLAMESDPRLRTVGGVEKGCRDILNADPVSFVTSDAFLMLPQWKRSPSANFKFDFKTVEQRGLVLYVEDNRTNDFIALEFFDGNLYVVSSRSGMPKRAMVPPKNLTDGKWHTVALFLQTDRNELRIKIDQGRFLIFNLSGDFDWKLQGSIRLGGTDFSTMHSTGRTPQLLWTASLKYGFIGCIQNVLKDGGSIDLMTIAKQSYRGTSSIAPECLNYGGNFCDSQPCRNGGVCKNQLNGFTCDCTATAYSGDTCDTATMVVGFNGSQCLRLPAANTKRYQAEELSLRFKTPFSSGLLFATTSSNTADIFLLRLVRGVVELTVNIDCFKTNCTNVTLRQGGTTLSAASSLNDNRWHYIAVRRYGNIVSLTVDNSTAKARELPNGYFELEFNNIHLGKVTGDVFPNPRRDFGPKFVGMIQNVRFNKNQVVERCLSNKKSACQFNGTRGESVIISNSVTFENRYNYIWMEKLNAYESMNLYFTLRTTVADGLILYNDGPSGDFVAVELYNGFVRYVYDLGNGPQFLSAPDQAPISDGKWHQVRIIRTRLNQHTLSVDGVSLTQNGRRENVNLDLDGDLYIGGVRKDMYTKAIFTAIQSRVGFQGCLATFDLNGYNPDLVSEAALVNSGKVMQGCRGPYNACDSRPCLNNGVCRQEWNGYSCDCSMTAYSGGKCQERRPSYVFNEGVMIYNWPPDGLPSSREDRLVIHFSTSTRNCVLARIDSGLRRGNLKEFMELRIKNGRLKLTFNIGTKSTTMTSYMNVADGQYHVAVVERHWMNASMVVDRSPIQRVAPKEEKNTVFNSKSRIQIGGRLASSSNGQIIDTCAGMMTAFSFSGIRVFSLANNGDPRVQIIGDVTRYVETATPTPLSVTTTTMVTMTTFRTSSSKSLSIGNASACNEELCDESNETTTLDLENAMLRDGQTSQITPGAKIPSVVILTTKATPSATPIKTTRPALVNPSPTTRVANNISNNGSGMDNLKADDTLKATSMFGKFFNGTTAVIAGIIGAAVLTIATLLWAIFKFKHRQNNRYRKGHRSSPCHYNGHAPVASDSRNGTLRNNKKKSKRKNGSNVDQEYYV